MYSVDEGKTTKEMAFKYKKNAEGIRILYPESAKIYDDLYKVFIINLRQKEGVLKMSINKNETYVGQSYKFTVGKGGNGEVFEANITNFQSEEKYVVKFLFLDRWNKEKLKNRYDRFHKEINTVLVLQKDISGIMKIVDFHCPKIMQKGKAVWYLMKKAETFNKFCKINKLDLKKKWSIY